MLLMRLHTAKAVDTGRLTTGGVPARRVIAQAHIQDHGMGSASGYVEFLRDVCHPFGVCTLMESARRAAEDESRRSTHFNLDDNIPRLIRITDS